MLPQTLGTCVPTLRVIPKSISCTDDPSLSERTIFSGLMSLCTRFLLCMYSTALQICPRYAFAVDSFSPTSGSIASNKSPPEA